MSDAVDRVRAWATMSRTTMNMRIQAAVRYENLDDIDTVLNGLEHARTELAKARSYRSLPDGYVWQDEHIPGYGTYPYSDTEPVLRLSELPGWPTAEDDLAKARNVIEQVEAYVKRTEEKWVDSERAARPLTVLGVITHLRAILDEAERGEGS